LPCLENSLNTYGGSVFAAFHAIDIIQQSSIPVYTIVEGATASAGTLMSVVGKRRFIRPHASMLIHELSSWFGGKMTNIDDEYQNLKQMMDDIKSIYLENTSLAKEEMEVRMRPIPRSTVLHRMCIASFDR
jgi:ATP-dependent protease ClpP protease subunit